MIYDMTNAKPFTDQELRGLLDWYKPDQNGAAGIRQSDNAAKDVPRLVAELLPIRAARVADERLSQIREEWAACRVDWGDEFAESATQYLLGLIDMLSAFRTLVGDAMFLCMYGERPPGAPRSTWDDWRIRAEVAMHANPEDQRV